MFSGIIEEYGIVTAIEREKDNVHFTLTCSFAGELDIDQSLSHNGVCLTVVEVDKKAKTYKVTAVKETLIKSNLGLLEKGSKVNLERSMVMNGRLDGHIVQGHVDQTAVCTKVEEANGSWYFTFEYSFEPEKAKQGYITVEKGSVTVNGVSLTVVNSKDNSFQVAIIPYTYEVTNFHTFKPGTVVNLEFDIIGKYLSKLISFTE
ncbi:MAG: riboflavin synthase [Prolixibacteraceae bacterium]|jgi:riboflavin synthase|nr:riboflavin synthase [Prolixibacteraceae bacterium]NLO03405.1 riboflavin synthase [Bacteroidales bacterium]